MNCWKSVNTLKDFDSSRLMLISLGITLCIFIISYLIFSLYYGDISSQGIGFTLTVAAIVTLYPVHTMLHYVPLWFAGIKTDVRLYKVKKKGKQKVTMKVQFNKPVAKNLYITALLFPSFLITIGALLGALTWPEYMHYFLLITSINAGLSVYDWVYVKQLIKAPKYSVVERNKNGVDILVKQPS
ncbi:DUF3267 domain-containing protein [Thalassorhabdus alkalitolerans]|uniref:DUF3267 domain-containing protein n=1 Tax=Thalassorhabdus alkalitolerans TaxID=2282697 RepID=A0ABW0YM76_9BACI